jgi:hypothetical protein
MGSDFLANPIDINNLNQIHTVFGSPKAIPIDPDLIWLFGSNTEAIAGPLFFGVTYRF